MWPSSRTPEQQALDNARQAQMYLGRLVQQLKGDDNRPTQARLLDAVGLLDRFADGVKDGEIKVEAAPLPQAPVPMRRPDPEPEPAAVPAGPRHRVGEGHTDPNLRRLRGNSGWRSR